MSKNLAGKITSTAHAFWRCSLHRCCCLGTLSMNRKVPLSNTLKRRQKRGATEMLGESLKPSGMAEVCALQPPPPPSCPCLTISPLVDCSRFWAHQWQTEPGPGAKGKTWHVLWARGNGARPAASLQERPALPPHMPSPLCHCQTSLNRSQEPKMESAAAMTSSRHPAQSALSFQHH